MSDPYFVALYRAAISAVILAGGTTAALLATDASGRSILAAFLVSFFGVMATRFVAEGAYDTQKRKDREADLIIQDAVAEGFIDGPYPRPVDFDEDYHFSSDGKDRHRGRLASDCALCLRERI